MHRNTRKRIITSQSGLQDNYFPDINEEKWLTYAELSNSYMNSTNLCNRITKFFYVKRKYIFYQARHTNMKQIEQTIKVRTPLGMFRMLPRNLLHSLFDRISAKQLLFISLTSRAVNTEVRRYLLLKNARQKFLAEITGYMQHNDIDTDPFYLWGMLLKASTIVMDSRSRRSFLTSFYSKNKNITNWLGWGRCFMAYCEKWDFCECEALLHAILCVTELNQLLYKVLTEETGKHPSLEMKIRLRLQSLFLSHSTEDKRDRGFWISAILRTQGTTDLQGKLFMIIFGPIKMIKTGHEIIDWKVLCEGNVNLQHISSRLLGSIALGFHHLTNTSSLGYYSWTNQQLFTLLEKISAVPNKWPLQNFAALLALRPQIIYIALFTRVLQGQMDEAANVFHAIKAVLHRWGIFVSGAISDVMLKIFRALPQANRRLFLSSILMTESQQLSELLLHFPFNAEKFHTELSSARSISALMILLAKNV